MEDRKSITLYFTDYVVSGRAVIKTWDDCIGTIEMNKFHSTTPNISLSDVNDGGFGCQEILAADVDIYENYEGHLVYKENLKLGDLELAQEAERMFYDQFF